MCKKLVMLCVSLPVIIMLTIGLPFMVAGCFKSMAPSKMYDNGKVVKMESSLVVDKDIEKELIEQQQELIEAMDKDNARMVGLIDKLENNLKETQAEIAQLTKALEALKAANGR